MNDPSGKQTEGKAEERITNPLSNSQSENRAALSAQEVRGSDGADGGGDKNSGPSRNFLGRLTINERLTLLVGIGSLAVAAVTCINAANTSDIQKAIGNLSELATQTKRQADATTDQLGAIRDQVRALRDQAEEAKRQTAAIASQTEAIKASSDAAIKSAAANVSAAEAQRKLAEIAAQTQKPDIDLLDLTLAGLFSDPDKDGEVHYALTWHFRDTGGSALTVEDVVFGLPIGDALPQQMPTGSRIDGAGIVLVNSITSAFGPTEAIQFTMPKATRDAITGQKTTLFFFAKIRYWDNLNAEHSRCFGREFELRGRDNPYPVPSGGSAYQCKT